MRAAGHDVTAIVEISPRAEDNVVIALSMREDRILLTEDKDFGQLVYATVKHAGKLEPTDKAVVLELVTKYAEIGLALLKERWVGKTGLQIQYDIQKIIG